MIQRQTQTWTAQSNAPAQLALSIGMALLGALFLYLCRGFGPDSNTRAGFFLGLLLAVVGVGGALSTGTQTVVVDPIARAIAVTDVGWRGRRTRTIRFAEVRGVSVGHLGKASSGVRTYFLTLHLSDGASYPLFAPGRCYDGCLDRATVDGWRERLEGYLRA